MTNVTGDMLGKLASTLYCLHLIFTCCSLFFATSILTIVRHGNFELVPCLLSITNVITVVCNLIILYSMVRTGQVREQRSNLSQFLTRFGTALKDLADIFRSIKEKLEDRLVDEANQISASERTGLQVLISRYGNPSPFRPADVFDMNFASAASVGGLILTYVIVLMQFKLGDSSVAAPAAAVATARG